MLLTAFCFFSGDYIGKGKGKYQPGPKLRQPRNSCDTNPTTADSNLLCTQGPHIGRQWAFLCTRDQDLTQRQQNYAGGKPMPAGTNGERNAKRKISALWSTTNRTSGKARPPTPFGDYGKTI